MESYELTDRDAELLSAYIDGELDAEQRSALETRLASEANLRRELRTLQQTVALVQEMPTLRAPRNFTLTREMAQPSAPRILPASNDQTPPRPALRVMPRRSPWRTALGTAAAIVLVMVGAVFVLNRMSSPQVDDNLQVAAVPTTQVAFTQQDEATLPSTVALATDSIQLRQSDVAPIEEEELGESEAVEEAVEESAEDMALERDQDDAQNDNANDSLGYAGGNASESDSADTNIEEAEIFDGQTSDEVAPAMMLPTMTIDHSSQPDTYNYAATTAPVPIQASPETAWPETMSDPESEPPIADTNGTGVDTAEDTDAEASIMAQPAEPEMAMQQKLEFNVIVSVILGEFYQSSNAVNLFTLPDGEAFSVQDFFNALLSVASVLVNNAEPTP